MTNLKEAKDRYDAAVSEESVEREKLNKILAKKADASQKVAAASAEVDAAESSAEAAMLSYRKPERRQMRPSANWRPPKAWKQHLVVKPTK